MGKLAASWFPQRECKMAASSLQVKNKSYHKNQFWAEHVAQRESVCLCLSAPRSVLNCIDTASFQAQNSYS